MQVNISYNNRRVPQATVNKISEARVLCEIHKDFIDKSIHDYIFVNVGPELTEGTVIRIPVLHLNKRILALYFRFCGYSNNCINVVLVSVIYPEAYPPIQDLNIPQGGDTHESLTEVF